MPNPSAPTSFRANDSHPTRDKWENELWDDLPIVVYNEAEDLTLDTVAAGAALVVCSFTLATYVPTRLQVTAQAYGNGDSIWTGHVRNNGANAIFSETQRMPAGFAGTVTWSGTIDINPGKYTLDINLAVDALSAAAVDFYNKRLIVRRGRKPVT